MAMPTDHPVEALTGLGAGGVDVILAYVGAHPIQGPSVDAGAAACERRQTARPTWRQIWTSCSRATN
jgi:hypothetical protein